MRLTIQTQQYPAGTLVWGVSEPEYTVNNVKYIGVRTTIPTNQDLGIVGITTKIIPAASGGNSGTAKNSVLTSGFFRLTTTDFNSNTLSPGHAIYLRFGESGNNQTVRWVQHSDYQTGDNKIGFFENETGVTNQYDVRVNFDIGRHAGNTDHIPEGATNRFLKEDTVLPTDLKADNDPANDKVYKATGTNTGTWIDTPSGGGTPGDGSITTAKLADSAVTTEKMANANVTIDKMATDSVSVAQVKTRNTGTNGQVLVKYSDTEFEYQDKAQSGQGSTPADGSVTEDKIASNAVTTNKIADGAVTLVKISNGVLPQKANETEMFLGNNDSKFSTPLLVDKVLDSELGEEVSLGSYALQTVEGDLASGQVFVENNNVKIHTISSNANRLVLYKNIAIRDSSNGFITGTIGFYTYYYK